MRAVALVDSDSYVKWGAALIGQLPAEWERDIVLVSTPVAPSRVQLRAALSGSIFDGVDLTATPLAMAVERVRSERPDVVLVSMRGPAACVVMRELARLESRPIIVSGLPGISVPATWKALYYRGQADLIVLHSTREIREFSELARERHWNHRLGLATLPFIDRRPVAGGMDIVFAAQAIVPRELADRERVIDILVETARANPWHRVVIKLRAIAGEQQTHAETYSYESILAARTRVPSNLVTSTSPMSHALESACGLVTVSSTAAIEAVARGLPVIALDDFGQSPELINEVFGASGLLASGDACIRREFPAARPSWVRDNYLHDHAENDWLDHLGDLVEARRSAALPDRRSLRPALGGALRRAWDRKLAFGSHDRSASGALAFAIGVPVRSMVRTVRRARRRVRDVAATLGG